MTVESLSLAELIQLAMDSKLADVHTAMPGKVVAYDADTQTADVELQFKHVLRDETGERAPVDLPTVPMVPVVFPGAGAYLITFPIAPGDTGLVLFSEYSIDRWRSQGEQVDPGDARRHGLSGAMFLPGLRTSAGKLDQSTEVSATAITLAPQVNLGSATATQPIVLGTALNTYLTALITWISTHTHTVTIPALNTPTPSLPPDTAAVIPGFNVPPFLPTHLSSKHKADA